MEMHQALRNFMASGEALRSVWDAQKVHHYPSYLPSFDQFLMDFSQIMDPDYDAEAIIAAARGDICHAIITDGPNAGETCAAWRRQTPHLEGCPHYRPDNSPYWTEPPQHCVHCKGELARNETGDLACTNPGCFHNEAPNTAANIPPDINPTHEAYNADRG